MGNWIKEKIASVKSGWARICSWFHRQEAKADWLLKRENGRNNILGYGWKAVKFTVALPFNVAGYVGAGAWLLATDPGSFATAAKQELIVLGIRTGFLDVTYWSSSATFAYHFDWISAYNFVIAFCVGTIMWSIALAFEAPIVGLFLLLGATASPIAIEWATSSEAVTQYRFDLSRQQHRAATEAPAAPAAAPAAPVAPASIVPNTTGALAASLANLEV